MRIKQILLLIPYSQQVFIKDYVTNRTLSTGTLCDIDLDLDMYVERIHCDDDTLILEVSSNL